MTNTFYYQRGESSPLANGDIGLFGVIGTQVDLQSAGSLNTDIAYGCFLCDATAGTVTLTLPPAAGNGGRIFIAKKIDGTGNSVIIQRAGADLIDNSITSVTYTTQHSVIMISDGGSSWWRIAFF